MPARGSVLTTCAALVLTTGVFTAGGAAATGSTGDDCDPDGFDLRYLVLFDPGTSKRQAAAETRAACGVSTAYYPEIAVGVVRARSNAFVERIGPDRAFSAEAQRISSTSDISDISDISDTSGISDVSGNSGISAIRFATEPGSVPEADRTGEQWDMRAINADAARSVEDGSPDVVVGVLDSGIDAKHPELNEAVTRSQSAGCLTGRPERSPAAWRPTTSAHGTHVAGIVAAADDDRGITGVAPGVRLASVRVIDDRGYADPEAVVCGLMWSARNDMKVTNSSYLVAPWSVSCAPGEGRQVVREAIERAASFAESSGTLNVAAASNQSTALTPSPRAADTAGPTGDDTMCEALPAGLEETVAVSAVGADGVKAGYSSYGLGVIDLAAPGGHGKDDGTQGDGCVLSTVPGGYEATCGTSMAAPHVTGVAALAASRYPDSTPGELRELLGDRARPIACPADYDLGGDGTQDAYCAGYAAYNGFYGRGLVDALATVTSEPAGTPSQGAANEHRPEQPTPDGDLDNQDAETPSDQDAASIHHTVRDLLKPRGLAR